MPHDSNNIPPSELDMLEQAMGMMHAPISRMFQEFFGPSLFQGTVISRPIESNHRSQPFDHFGGDDFRQLASKSRRNRGIPEESEPPKRNNTPSLPPPPTDNFPPIHASPMHSLFQFVLGGNDMMERPMFPEFENQQHEQRSLFDIFVEQRPFRDMDMDTNNDLVPIGKDASTVIAGSPGRNWTFSSSSMSQRRVLRPDGTEETVYTETQNGVTKTIRRIKRPDGTIEETQEKDQGSFMNRLTNGEPTGPSEPVEGNPLSRMLNRFLGR